MSVLQRSIRIAGAFAGLLLSLSLAPAMAEPIETTAQEAFIMDYDTGAVLYQKNADMPVHPASMSKLMTLYLLFEDLKAGKVQLDDMLAVSEDAWALNEGSTMFVGINSSIAIEDLIRGIIVQSGNDACVVVAEGLAGSEAAFVDRMNEEAKRLGLANSHFANSHGLEDPNHQMTAHDLAILARHLIADFPEYYHYFAEKEFVFNGIKQGNRNPLLYKDPSVDGLKTGHLSVSGFGVTISAKRDDRRIIMVLHGMANMQERSDEAQRVLDWAFREYDNYTIAKVGMPMAEAPVWLGQQPTVPLVVGADLLVTLPRAVRDQVTAKAVFEAPIAAPIPAGESVGELIVSAPGMEDRTVPLVTGATVEKLGFFGRIMASLKHYAGLGA
ncbi:MAG: D-alanyl-D-alanine carboxypeptidase family protein [Dongiaceae bacterium]